MRIMKILWILLFFSHTIIAQDITECTKVVDLTVTSINKQSTDELSKYLSDDFMIAGQKGVVAKIVLKQLFSQLGETVNSHHQEAVIESENELVLKYNIDYENKGMKEATFTFNRDNLLKGLELFEMEVKTMKGESEVQKPDNSIIEIPFNLAGKFIVVDVEWDGEKKPFILDTGSPKVILNSKHMSGFDSNQKSISSTKGVNGNISGMDISKVNKLDFGGIQLVDQKVVTLDLSKLEEELGMEFFGLIGYELIKEFDIIIDYERQVLILINPDDYEKYRVENLSDNTFEKISFSLESHIPVVKAQIHGESYSFGIDSGAETNLIDNRLWTRLKRCVRDIGTDELSGAGPITKEVKTGKIKKTKIGNTVYKNLDTVFSDISHLNNSYKIKLDGIMGYELLSKQTTLISYHRKEMIFIR